jgi:hypothetical protein
MKIIHYSESYSSKKAKQIEKMLSILWIFILAIITGYVLLMIFVQGNRHYWIIAIGVIFLIIFAVKNKNYQLINKILSSFKRGDMGEEMVIEKLKPEFNDSYTYVANYSNKSACYGDIDGILVGPTGLFILEVKNWHGLFRISGTDIYRHISNDLYKLYKSPAEQLGVNKEKLTKYLQDKKIAINVHPFIVLVDGCIQTFNGNTGIFITRLDKIANIILNNPGQNLTQEQVSNILSVLGVNEEKGFSHL